MGFLGITVKSEYGGTEGGYFDHCLISNPEFLLAF